MNAPAFMACYSDWRLVKTRAVIQVIFEVPLADADTAYEVLGGMPVHANERWFGIAAIDTTKAEPQRRNWRDLPPAQQAGIRCDEPSFASFLKEQRSDDWKESPDAVDCVYLICGISSRAELGTNHKARVLWHQLDTEYQAWLAKERVGA